MLLHKSKPIPGAAETLKYLQTSGIPFVFLTNGGGKSEAERAAQLSSILGVELDPSAVVQSHTPFKTLLDPNEQKDKSTWDLLKEYNLAAGLRNKTVMVTGSDASKARRIAIEYGFDSVVTPGDILKACPEIFPFDPLCEFYDKQEILPLPKPIYSPDNALETLEKHLKIDAVLVFNDPRDWAVDIQLITDLLLSHQGYLGTRASDFADGEQADALSTTIPVIYSNCDLLWSAGYHLPRFGQGAFQHALRKAFSEARIAAKRKQAPVPFRFGKPFAAAYQHAETALVQLLQKNLGILRSVKRIYMVGDNPHSDILGVRKFNWKKKKPSLPSGKEALMEKDQKFQVSGPEWKACLVRTGVWKDSDGFPSEKHTPHVVQDDVKCAIEWALKEEGCFEKDWLQRSE